MAEVYVSVNALNTDDEPMAALPVFAILQTQMRMKIFQLRVE